MLTPVLFIPHGGGPLPLFNDARHAQLIPFLKSAAQYCPNPEAIILISAHWEERMVHVTSAPQPELYYDYYGFPEASYKLNYPAPGHPELAASIVTQLQDSLGQATATTKRGFDHGMFVPLMLMYPKGHIPVVQVSLLDSLSPQDHIQLGKALQGFRTQNVLILGSGFSFHNLQAFFQPSPQGNQANQAFQSWLLDTCTAEKYTQAERSSRLIDWQNAPHAQFCHPRAEHLLPLHVCYGASTGPAECIFDDLVFSKRSIGLMWRS